MMGELKYFLGFQVKQLQEGTFISQTKYIQDILTLQHEHPCSNTYIATKWFMRCKKLGSNRC
jgi:hypothetical protein